MCIRDRHHRGAAILEASGRGKPFQLEVDFSRWQLALDQRRQTLAEADGFLDRQRQGGAVTPDRARRGVDLGVAEARQRRHHQGVALRRAPQWRGQGKRLSGDGVEVAVIDGHGGNLMALAQTGIARGRGTRGETGLRGLNHNSRPPIPERDVFGADSIYWTATRVHPAGRILPA